MALMGIVWESGPGSDMMMEAWGRMLEVSACPGKDFLVLVTEAWNDLYPDVAMRVVDLSVDAERAVRGLLLLPLEVRPAAVDGVA